MVLVLITFGMSALTGIAGNILFIDHAPPTAFALALLLALVTCGCTLLSWTCSANGGRISSLLIRLQITLAWPAFMTLIIHGLFANSAAGRLHGVYLALLVLAIASLGVLRWQIRHPNLPKPVSPGLQKANCVAWSYGTPIWIFALIAGFLAIVSVLAGAVLFEIHGLPGLRPKQVAAGIVVGCLIYCVVVLLVCDLARNRLRTRFPDSAYIWLTTSTLNVRGRMTLALSKINRIEFHWSQSRSGRYRSGLNIYSSEINYGDCVTISFLNVTAKPDEVLQSLKDDPATGHIAFDYAPVFVGGVRQSAATEDAIRRLYAQTGRRLLQKNPNFESEITARIAAVPEHIAKVDDLIAARRKLNSENIENLADLNAKFGWPEDGTLLAVSRTWPDNLVAGNLSAEERKIWFDDKMIESRNNLQRWINDFPAQIEALENQKQIWRNSEKTDRDMIEKYFNRQ